MPKSIDELLDDARARLRRVTPAEAARILDEGGLLIDTRNEAKRRERGEIPGAIVVDRDVLEWRLDPASPHRLREVVDHDQAVVVICAEGYASSLVAATLQDLGLHRATDVIGGFEAWAAAGLPVNR
jgi:rhodanese-related sulfurtransferase